MIQSVKNWWVSKTDIVQQAVPVKTWTPMQIKINKNVRLTWYFKLLYPVSTGALFLKTLYILLFFILWTYPGSVNRFRFNVSTRNLTSLHSSTLLSGQMYTDLNPSFWRSALHFLKICLTWSLLDNENFVGRHFPGLAIPILQLSFNFGFSSISLKIFSIRFSTS